MSNNKPRQVYTREFKREAIELARTSGKPVTELAPKGAPGTGVESEFAQLLDPAGQSEGQDSFARARALKARLGRTTEFTARGGKLAPGMRPF